MRPAAREHLAREYTSALNAYLSGAGETALVQAYELGRIAAGAGVGLLEIALMYQEALQTLPPQSPLSRGPLSQGPPGDRAPAVLAAQFFTESLSPFEMTLRAYQAHARLLGLSETLAQEHAEIDRAREQLRTILDATTAIIYLKDAEGRYLFVNLRFQRVFGLRREQVIGKTDAEVLPASIADALRKSDLEVLRAGTPQEQEEAIPVDGSLHTYLSLKFPLLDAAAAPYAICCVATDITERKRADEALRRAKEAAEAANSELESFSYSVAHDLRGPLRTIDGFSQALMEDCADQLDSQGKRYLQFIRSSSVQMAELIDDLLGLARLAQAELRHARVDLSALARNILERLQAIDKERRVNCLIHEGMTASGDAHLLGAVLENLLGNAWKFTGRRPIAEIEFGVERQERPVRYFIRDNGAGFDMAYAHKLFGAFQRLHATSDFEGTGIGLATVQRIVRRHGGRIWAEAAVDRGATFYFTLEEEPPV
jgi:PAS domain S-box-containing protein